MRQVDRELDDVPASSRGRRGRTLTEPPDLCDSATKIMRIGDLGYWAICAALRLALAAGAGRRLDRRWPDASQCCQARSWSGPGRGVVCLEWR